MRCCSTGATPTILHALYFALHDDPLPFLLCLSPTVPSLSRLARVSLQFCWVGQHRICCLLLVWVENAQGIYNADETRPCLCEGHGFESCRSCWPFQWWFSTGKRRVALSCLEILHCTMKNLMFGFCCAAWTMTINWTTPPCMAAALPSKVSCQPSYSSQVRFLSLF